MCLRFGKKKYTSEYKQLGKIIKELKKYEKIELIDQKEYEDNGNIVELCSNWNNLVQLVDECCNCRISKENLRAEYDRANVILTAYYETGKILDYFERVNLYVSELVDDEDIAVAAKGCYNNYIYFIAHFVEELKEKYKSLDIVQKADVSIEENQRQYIIEQECGELVAVALLKMKIDTAKQLFDKVLIRSYSDSDKSAFLELTDFMKKYDKGSTGLESLIDDDISKMKYRIEQVSDQISKINAEIETANELYNSLDRILSTEWFDQFKPDKICAGTEICKELRTRLELAMSEVNEKIVSVYIRK